MPKQNSGETRRENKSACTSAPSPSDWARLPIVTTGP
jgi:hypothetical protein